MKNVVLTFHDEVNYGAVFQTLALQTVLKRYGDSAVLDFKMMKSQKIRNAKDFIYKLAEKRKSVVLTDFLKKNVSFTEHVKNVDEIKLVCNQFNNVIVGSDQVWAKDIVSDFFDIYTLNFDLNKGVNKISYAASVGKSEMPMEDLILLNTSLKKYRSISVREASTKDLLRGICDKNIEVTLDPTLLLSSNEWDVFSEASSRFKNYIFVYMLEINQDIIDSVKKLRDLTGLKIICLNNKNHFGKGTICLPFCKPSLFLHLIKNADYVVTNSFHGTCFSIIYNKKFGVHLHTTKSVRQREILEKLDLNYAIINDDINKLVDIEYDYKSVNEKLDVMRKDSIKFIENSIGVADE